MQGYNDANKYLPFTGNINAIGGNNVSGSWGFQILPYIDQGPYFATPASAVSIAAFMCPGRARNTTVGSGSSTDYMYNLLLNDQTIPNNPLTNGANNKKRTMVGITDGTSNTIFAGHGQISQGNYGNPYATSTGGSAANGANCIAGTINLARNAATDFGTTRGSTSVPTANAAPAVLFGRDPAGTATSLNAWGGPFSQGGLMGMGDGTVRLFPYNMNTQTLPALAMGGFLTPSNGEVVTLPDT